jgi:hypothetical protein
MRNRLLDAPPRNLVRTISYVESGFSRIEAVVESGFSRIEAVVESGFLVRRSAEREGGSRTVTADAHVRTINWAAASRTCATCRISCAAISSTH